ncbi:hypothetical protein [Burkholderia glumae]
MAAPHRGQIRAEALEARAGRRREARQRRQRVRIVGGGAVVVVAHGNALRRAHAQQEFLAGRVHVDSLS